MMWSFCTRTMSIYVYIYIYIYIYTYIHAYIHTYVCVQEQVCEYQVWAFLHQQKYLIHQARNRDNKVSSVRLHRANRAFCASLHSAKKILHRANRAFCASLHSAKKVLHSANRVFCASLHSAEKVFVQAYTVLTESLCKLTQC